MTAANYQHIRDQLMSNLLVDPGLINQVHGRLENGKITTVQAIEELKKIERRLASVPVGLSEQAIEDEWVAILDSIKEIENSILKESKRQYHIGVLVLPVSIIVAVFSLGFGWQNGSGAVAAATVISSCLAAAAVHSFLLLRVYQQASLAAERLTEKRVGVLYLRLAALGKGKDSSKDQVEAGTAMFLNHQAPSTLPLNSSDMIRQSQSTKSGASE